MHQFISSIVSLIAAASLLITSVGISTATTTDTLIGAPAQNPVQQSSPYWLGEYFNNPNLAGRPIIRRVTRQVLFNWGTASPSRYIKRDNFSVRWSWPSVFVTGVYRISARVDDGIRVYVDNRLVIDDWREGSARDISADVSLSGAHLIKVEYFERTGFAYINVNVAPVSTLPITATPIPAAPPEAINANWRGEYFNNINLIGTPSLVRGDNAVNFDWGNGSPSSLIQPDNFSVRWTGRLPAGNYRLILRVDDGVRMFINGGLVIDSWIDAPARDVSTVLTLVSPADTRIEYYEHGGGALIQMSTGDPNTPTNFPDWRGEYYNNTSLSGTPALLRNDTSVNFDFGSNSPGNQVVADNFSARWTRTQNFDAGTYQIDIAVDDGMRVFVDDALVIDEWHEGPPRNRSAQVNLSAGQHRLRVEFFELGGGATAKFSINRVQVTPTPMPVILPTITPVPF